MSITKYNLDVALPLNMKLKVGQQKFLSWFLPKYLKVL